VSNALVLRNRQNVRKLDSRFLRRIVSHCLQEALAISEYELGIQLVDAEEMTHLNQSYLRHKGSTDVITFDYSPHPPNLSARPEGLHGDIVVCIDEAIIQNRRFGTRWPEEVVRYIVHGILHLAGHDDRTEKKRRAMKKIENHIMRELSARFPLRTLSRKRKHKNG